MRHADTCSHGNVPRSGRWLITFLPAKRLSDVLERDAAVDHELEAGDVAALVAGEIDRRPGDVPGIAAKSHRHLAVAGTPHLLDIAARIALGEAGAVLDHRRLHQP